MLSTTGDPFRPDLGSMAPLPRLHRKVALNSFSTPIVDKIDGLHQQAGQGTAHSQPSSGHKGWCCCWGAPGLGYVGKQPTE